MKKNFIIMAISLLISILTVACSGPAEKTIETSAVSATNTDTSNTDGLLPFGFTPKEFYNSFSNAKEANTGELKKISDTESGFIVQSTENDESTILLHSNLAGYVTTISLPFKDITIDSFVNLARAVLKATDTTINYENISETLKFNDPPKTIDDYRFCNSQGISFTLSSTGFRINRDAESPDSYSYSSADVELLTSAGRDNESQTDETNDEAAGKSIPSEYRSALSKAQDYSDMMHMSKAGIYNQLTSEYGEQFSAEAAQYAVDNIEADWDANALKKAKEYNELMHMSKLGLYSQLTSEHGEKFLPSEAQFAVDNIDANWKENALEKAKEYQELMSMSPTALHDQLTSDYGEKFTQEEADYAIENLD